MFPEHFITKTVCIFENSLFKIATALPKMVFKRPVSLLNA